MSGPAWTLEPAHLDAALAAVRAHAVRTPLVRAPALGDDVWIKDETQQHTGSFKVRGALARVLSLDPDQARAGVIAASAGNHGLGVAYAARIAGIRARVFVPRTAARVKRDGIAALGAEVVVTEAPGFDETDDLARDAAARDGAIYVSPFDDPLVVAGNGGTTALEIFEDLPGAAVLVAPIGGGGLAIGLAAGRERARSTARLVGVQSEASPVMRQSLELGRAIERFTPTVATLAEGLEGGVSKTAFQHVRRSFESVEVVSEEAIADAMRFARQELGCIVEGSAAVAIAWARVHARAERGPVVVLLTGRNVDLDVLDKVHQIQ